MFTFKLQSVRNYRQAVEEQKQVEFAEGKRQLEKERAMLAAMREEKAGLMRKLKDMQQITFNAAEVSLYLSYHERFSEKEAKQLEMVHKAEAEVACRRTALMEAMQKRQIMDRLNENKLVEHQKALKASERQGADEAAVMRFVRAKR